MREKRESMTQIADILRKLDALQRLAKDQAGTPEGTAAAAKVAEMMATYQITHADVMRAQVFNEGVVREDYKTRWARQLPKWANMLAVQVARTNGCEMRYIQKAWKGISVAFFGPKVNTQVASWMYDYLLAEIESAARKFARSIPAGEYNKRSMVGDFRYTMSQRIVARLKAASAEVKQTDNSRALVVTTKALVEQRFGRFTYKQSDSRDVWQNSLDGGRAAGDRVDLNRRGVSQGGVAGVLT